MPNWAAAVQSIWDLWAASFPGKRMGATRSDYPELKRRARGRPHPAHRWCQTLPIIPLLADVSVVLQAPKVLLIPAVPVR